MCNYLELKGQRVVFEFSLYEQQNTCEFCQKEAKYLQTVLLWTHMLILSSRRACLAFCYQEQCVWFCYQECGVLPSRTTCLNSVIKNKMSEFCH